jgi:hypothetical protein
MVHWFPVLTQAGVDDQRRSTPREVGDEQGNGYDTTTRPHPLQGLDGSCR